MAELFFFSLVIVFEKETDLHIADLLFALKIRKGINKVDKSYTFSVFYTFINLKPLSTLRICANMCNMT